jgi:hypothetical protein
MAYSVMESTVVLANLASGGTSWRTLYPSRSGFERGRVGVARSVSARLLIRGCRCREAVQGIAVGVAMSCHCVVPQRRGWRYSGWDGRTGLVVTEGACPTSRHGPGRERNRRLSPFEGSAVSFRGRGVPAVREWVAQCRGVDPSLTAQRRIVARMASPGE